MTTPETTEKAEKKMETIQWIEPFDCDVEAMLDQISDDSKIRGLIRGVMMKLTDVNIKSAMSYRNEIAQLKQQAVEREETNRQVSTALVQANAQLEDAENALNWMRNNRALTILIDEPAHVANFFEKADAYHAKHAAKQVEGK